MSISTATKKPISHSPDEPLEWKMSHWSGRFSSTTDVTPLPRNSCNDKQPDPTSLVPFLPAAKVALSVKSRMITGKIHSQLRHYCTPRSNIFAELIDWPIFSAVTNSKSSFNHLLPLHSCQHKMSMSPSSQLLATELRLYLGRRCPPTTMSSPGPPAPSFESLT
jgi:hypothetical protein